MGNIQGTSKALMIAAPLVVLSLPAGLARLEGGRWEPLSLVLTMAGAGLLNLGALLLKEPAFIYPVREAKGPSRLGLACLLGAAAAGLLLILKGRFLVLVLGPAGAALGLVGFLVPTVARLPGFSLARAFFCFGPLLTWGGYYALSGEMSLLAGLVGLPSGLLMAAAIWSDDIPGQPRSSGPALEPRRTAPVSPGKGTGSGPSGPIQGTLFDLEEGAEDEAGARVEPAIQGRSKVLGVLVHLALTLAAFGSLIPLGLRSSLGLLILTGLAPLPLALSGSLALGRPSGPTGPSPAGRQTLRAGVCLSLLLGLSLAWEGWLRA